MKVSNKLSNRIWPLAQLHKSVPQKILLMIYNSSMQPAFEKRYDDQFEQNMFSKLCCMNFKGII